MIIKINLISNDIPLVIPLKRELLPGKLRCFGEKIFIKNI